MSQVRTSKVDFIKAYNAAETLDEVSEKLGIAVNSIRSRARALANDGIPMRKLYSEKGGEDLEELKRIAEEALPAGKIDLLSPKAKG